MLLFYTDAAGCLLSRSNLEHSESSSLYSFHSSQRRNVHTPPPPSSWWLRSLRLPTYLCSWFAEPSSRTHAPLAAAANQAMARKKIREYDSKRLLKEHLKRLAGIDLQFLSAQVRFFLLLLLDLKVLAFVSGDPWLVWRFFIFGLIWARVIWPGCV